MWLLRSVVIIISWFQLFITVISDLQIEIKKDLEIRNDIKNLLLMFATIDGSLWAIDQITGEVRWKNSDKPVVKVPMGPTDSVVPLIVPDPKEGSLYLLDGTRNDYLKKLPFTIPELVTSCPCRSSDGILYTGEKADTWYWLDQETGFKRYILGYDLHQDMCPIASDSGYYIGRTKYNIKMIDSKHPLRHWNMTFFDYSSISMTEQMLNDYEYVHFASSSTGLLKTYDKKTGKLIWSTNLNSTIVSAYILNSEGLINLPFSTVANFSFQNISNIEQYKSKYLKTLYIGEHNHGLYALTTYVDENHVESNLFKYGSFLLKAVNQSYSNMTVFISNKSIWLNKFYNNDLISIDDLISSKPLILGYYYLSEYTDRLLEFIPDNDIQTPKKVAGYITGSSNLSLDDFKSNEINNVGNVTFFSDQLNSSNLNKLGLQSFLLFLVLMFTCIFVMFYKLWARLRVFEQLSQSGSHSNNIQLLMDQTVEISEEFPDGTIRVGKIDYFPNKILGKGCDGTVVYEGVFDKRAVAVKRLLPEYFNIADREVGLLRQSDCHQNVIRYFCTERDRQFQFIALELCASTVQDYVQNYSIQAQVDIQPLSILEQATAGLHYLHSLNIVHRDIKPQNVLLSKKNAAGKVRAMISDFGLCKKLQSGKTSISKASGVTGTAGWIAPEMFNNQGRVTFSVDIFSLGCLFYYVLTNGEHPFGSDTFKRQMNITNETYDLNHLKDDIHDDLKAKFLINKMIEKKPELRPDSATVLNHLLFWSKSRELAFLQDVSDRIEKLDVRSEIVDSLEKNSIAVVRFDWRHHICTEVANDLRRHRTYIGCSVRDLLRAIRNKKNHFQELSPIVQESLGEIPEKFLNYWTKRYPLLISHIWLTMQKVKNEKIFHNYYSESFTFIQFDKIYEPYYNDIKNKRGDYTFIDKIAETNPTIKSGLYADEDDNWRDKTIGFKNFEKSPRQKTFKHRNYNYKKGAFNRKNLNKNLSQDNYEMSNKTE